jgi:glycosyl transferase family 25
MNKIEHIYYINLEHRKERNIQFLEELTNMNIIPTTSYERFPAIYHKTFGGVGCGRSHIAVLEDALEKGYNQIMIFEDDFTFVVSPSVFYDKMEKLTEKEYDVCMLSYHLFDSEECSEEGFRKVLNAQTTSGYIIKKHYYKTLIDLFKWSVENFEKTNHHWLYAIDAAWTTLQRRDNWLCFYPIIGKQRISYSDCSNTICDSDW